MQFQKKVEERLGETLYFGTHESGLDVFVLPKKGFSKKYAIYSVKYGSIDTSYLIGDQEINDPMGIAHFLEHKLFELPGGGNAFDLFSKTGGNANAFTSHDMTGYLFSCSEHFNENLDVLLSYVNEPYFTVENVAKEQGIIAQEIKMYDDDPEWRLFNNALEALYHTNPVRNDIAGTVESIAQINQDLLYQIYNTFYHPENMVLFVAGDVDISDVANLVDKNVKKKEIPFSVVRKQYAEPDCVKQKRIVKEMSVSQPSFILGFKENHVGLTGKELLRKNMETGLILKMLFSQSAPLYNKLYQQGLINDTFGFDCLNSDTYFATFLNGEAKDIDKTVEAVLLGIESAKQEGFRKEDVERYKKAAIGRQIRAYDSIEAVANQFSSNYFYGIGAFDFLEIYPTITEEILLRRMQEIFNEHYAVSEMHPVAK
ncbi:MAG: insulinase family protein [Clostridia bacterium]|nr:insulinase family protein [Clostridia bacterium]